MNYEHEIELLTKQVKELRRQAIETREYIDTVSSPLWKRVIWYFEGYHFWKVGRWYDEKYNPKILK